MWTKLSSTFKSKQADDEHPMAGPSSSPSKRKSAGFLHRDGGSLRLNSIPHKVKSTFNLHGNSSQLTVASNPSQEALSNTALRPKATRRSSFNLLMRRPSIDALRPAPRRQSIDALRSPIDYSTSHNTRRERAATVSGSVRSILREPNTPVAGKNVRFFAHGEFDLDNRAIISHSTPPEQVIFHHSSPPKITSHRSPIKPSRPSVVDIFAPSHDSSNPPGQSTFDNALDLATYRQDHNKTPTTSHSRNASLSSQSVLSSKRSSSSKSSISEADTSFTTTTSSSSSIGLDHLLASAPEVSSPNDPFGVHAKTYYTPQTLIPNTSPGRRHIRRASKEENIIFSLQTQLAMQGELCGQYESDLRARDQQVVILRQKLEEAEEEDAKKRKYLKAWKKKVLDLEKTCRYMESEIETSHQESMERSVMDEASSEALRMLHRQISALERERDTWRKAETSLGNEIRRLESLVTEQRNEASINDEDATQQHGLEELGSLVTTLEEQLAAEKLEREQTTKALESQNAKLQAITETVKSRGEEIARLRLQLDSAEKTNQSLKSAEASVCSLAMERDALKMQLSRFQVADRRVGALEHDLEQLQALNVSLKHQLQSRIDAEKEMEDRFEERFSQQAILGQQKEETLLKLIEDLKQESATVAIQLNERQLVLENENAKIRKDWARDKQEWEAKQHELESLKRRSIGTAPPPSKISTIPRRPSILQATPTPRHRPSSIVSESGSESIRERKASAESVSRIPVSSRSSPKVTHSTMGPPPLRSRPSLISNNAPKPPIRSPSISPLNKTQGLGKSKIVKVIPCDSENNEKENVVVSTRRLSRIPTLPI
ncbi:hypothetical protein MIND_01053200 [Mycena indigotica]|uniref:Uncharacterized protein n=1 Tax=Mycena indigotica TaxID=2126181 RepID=A0A8H6SA24_9AGAR|nr:uncharacterized protein MIND_01053200 [Mycena indigotica]KAF7295147.1 hypothetical protein MIND_01053200 [Mycena indigotica]